MGGWRSGRELQVVARALSPTQAATRRRLLEAARAIATEGGYDAVDVRRVAERAGVSTPTAYRYFCSKDHLLVDPSIELVAATTAAVRTRPSRGRVAVDRTAATLRRAVKRVEQDSKLYVAMMRACISGNAEVALGESEGSFVAPRTARSRRSRAPERTETTS